jgi:peptidoglycan hydrolase-like protein with peptidoglycan-binding domain
MAKQFVRGISLSLIFVGLVDLDTCLLSFETGQHHGRLVFAQRRSQSTKKRRVTPTRGQRKGRRYRRRRSRSRMVSAAPGTLIPRERVVAIQKALIERNFLKGSPTGVYDRATIDAMKAFQASQTLEVTGYPTAGAIHRLGLPPGPDGPTPPDGSTNGQSSSSNTTEPVAWSNKNWSASG